MANQLPYFIHFVGPFQKDDKSILKMQVHPRIVISPACPVEKLQLNNVLASFIPYQANVRENDAISLPNKTLHLLSRGLPPLITGMPHFIKEPFVFRLTGNIRQDLIVIDDLKHNFHRVQSSIERFVSDNSSEVRLKTFLDIVDSCLTSVPLKIFDADGQ